MELPEARPVAMDALPPARVQPVVPPQYSQLHSFQMPEHRTLLDRQRPNSEKSRLQHPPQLPHLSRQHYTLSVQPHWREYIPGQQHSRGFLTPCPLPLCLSCCCWPVLPHFPPLSLEPFHLSLLLTHLKVTLPPDQTAVQSVCKPNMCRMCGQFCSQETGNSQYKGKIFCPNKETVHVNLALLVLSLS